MRTRILQSIAILSLVALFGGCSKDSPMGPSTPRHTSRTTQSGYQLTASTAKASYAFGETITIDATIKNVTDQPLVMDFERGDPARYPNVNVNVDDDGGFAVFVDGEGEQDTYTLAPGKSLSYSYTWDQNNRITRAPVDRGVYEVKVFSVLKDTQLNFAPLDLELK
jgi:hypothetical protein